MGVNWTKEQQQVIDLQDRNILVSAAAGSGKTAVLVERILQKITRKDHPTDIDRLLVVTFTRAAAGEMRERLMNAVEQKLETDPDNEHLQRQQTLIHNAQINTIDGFCSYVIRNYFHTIDLDPGFRVANEGELRLLKQDTIKELLEEEYAEDSGEFQQFVETFASGKTDEGLGDIILRLYEFSMSNPWPEEWLDSCKSVYENEDFKEIQNSSWMKKMWEDAARQLETAEENNNVCLQICMESDGPYMYQEAIEDDGLIIKQLKNYCADKDYDGCCEVFDNLKYTALSRKKDDAVSEKAKEQVKGFRETEKAILKKLGTKYFYGSSGQIMEELSLCRVPIEELVRLTKKFLLKFQEKKRKRNLLDFTDMEHLALQILVRKEDGELVYTQAADEFSQRFEEILIDEYQDSNLVQEMLLQSVSRLRQGKNNIFMVGDVKQSIYRFRLARPELFMEKYETYTKEDGPCQRIDLHKNFRSRPQVLEAVNYLFQQFMCKELGDIEYDSEAALYPGASYPEIEDGSVSTQLLVVETDAEDIAADEELAEKTAQELEARAVGARIRKMVETEQIVDKKTGEYRPVRYQDCVILLRTLSGWADTFVKVLMSMGIPAYTASKTGYFSTTEIVTILNYLHICDNPRQEIPFAGVLMSPIGGFTPEEMGVIKSEFPQDTIYECAREYAESGERENLREKLKKFFEVYEIVRERVPYTPIHELIQFVLKITGYDVYALALPGGKQRSANLEMLIEKAIEYESTSYRGLFNFVRYIEQLQKYEVDFGEVSTVGENENTVRIMSIHKSKGLEFPVVFVSGMGKRINMMDANNSMIIHPDLGIGANGIDPELRIKVETLIHNVMQKQIRIETLGEELRILYVALTRAKEKLILTGTLSGFSDTVEKLHMLTQRFQVKLSYGTIEGAASYWDWVLPAAARHPAFDSLYEQESLYPAVSNPCYRVDIPMEITKVCGEELTSDEMSIQIAEERRYLEYSNWNLDQVYQKETGEMIEEKFSYQYPYSYLQDIPAKLSVSQLKHEAIEEIETENIFKENEEEEVIPSFMKKTTEEKAAGTTRGTAYHRIMELLNYDKVGSREEILEQMEEMEKKGQIDPETKELVRTDKILNFAKSSLGLRMKQAAENKTLYREQPFVMSVPAKTQNPLWGEEAVLVQGIIDAFFQEGENLILVDYKTDNLKGKDETELIKRYKVQLQYYAMSLEKVTGREVREAYLYSFYLGREVKVDLKAE